MGKKKTPFIPTYYTPAQETMRDEMLDIFRLDSALNEILRPAPQSELGQLVAERALAIIEKQELSLSLKQWAVVQAMVEEGIRQGLHQAGSIPG